MAFYAYTPRFEATEEKTLNGSTYFRVLMDKRVPLVSLTALAALAEAKGLGIKRPIVGR